MKAVVVGGIAAAVASAIGISSMTASAASTVCVGGPHCYPTLAAAVAAAHDGDTVRVNAGRYAGGIADQPRDPCEAHSGWDAATH